MNGVKISCPKCGWLPDETCLWICSVCSTVWNTFDTRGQCPACGKVYESTACIPRKGGCGEMSPHEDWYTDNPALKRNAQSVFSFWKEKKPYPVTENDKAWIEHTLFWLSNKFGSEKFKSLATISPPELYFDYDFKKSEEDGDFLLMKIGKVIDLDVSQIRIMYFSETPVEISEDELMTEFSEQTHSLENSSEKIGKQRPEPNVLWVGTEWLDYPDELVALLAYKLMRHKLFVTSGIKDIDSRIVELTVVAFGFGVFVGNSYCRSLGNAYPDRWYVKMKTSGYLPLQVGAYVMAWLAHYREEDTSWKQYLNKTMKSYFDQSYRYIAENRDLIKWK